MKQDDVIRTAEWAEKYFGSLATNGQCPRRDVMRLVKRGLMKSVGMVALCDGDGWFVEPERYGEGFVLTEEGRKLAARNTNENLAREKGLTK